MIFSSAFLKQQELLLKRLGDQIGLLTTLQEELYHTQTMFMHPVAIQSTRLMILRPMKSIQRQSSVTMQKTSHKMLKV